MVKLILGNTYLRNDQVKEAEECYEKAAPLDPNNLHIRMMHAQALAKEGKIDKAKEMLRKAQSLDTQQKRTLEIERLKTKIETKEKSMR